MGQGYRPQLSGGEAIAEQFRALQRQIDALRQALKGGANPRLPFAMDAGLVSVSAPAAGGVGLSTVFFNTGFTAPPIVVTTPATTVIGTTVRGTAATAVGQDSFVARCYRINDTPTGVYWVAVQMEDTAAAGALAAAFTPQNR